MCLSFPGLSQGLNPRPRLGGFTLQRSIRLMDASSQTTHTRCLARDTIAATYRRGYGEAHGWQTALLQQRGGRAIWRYLKDWFLQALHTFWN